VWLAESDTALNVSALLHTILFAYQKKLNEVLGSGEAIFVHPVLATISKIDKKSGLSVIRGGSLAEVFENFAKDLVA
jgi:phosphoribosylaminoimidazole (AIR) synthetase